MVDIMDILLVVIGLALLAAGGEFLVRGSIAIAGRLGLSQLLIGMTVVGFGTSSPELIVSLTAALNGTPDIALGNVVGSNIANVFLILGFAALFDTLQCKSGEIKRDSLFVVLVSIVVAGLALYGHISRPVGLGLATVLVLYLAFSYFMERSQQETSQQETGEQSDGDDTFKYHKGLLIPVLFVLAGFAALFFGARWLVMGAVAIATDFGVPQTVIGLTLIAIGTSLPELATSAVAAIRKQSGIIIGNVLGSNLFNILGILGITAAVTPMEVGGLIVSRDIWVMLGAAIVLLIIIRLRGVISPIMGLLFLLFYFSYMYGIYLTDISS